jgi:type I restriction enzyme M protein
MLGLVFLKYVSDAFDIRRDELKAQFTNPDHEYFLDPADFDGGAEGEEYQAEIAAELEVRDYYLETNTFWVPPVARWQFLRDNNKVVIGGAELPVQIKGETKRIKISSVGHLIDHALEAIEIDNQQTQRRTQ